MNWNSEQERKKKETILFKILYELKEKLTTEASRNTLFMLHIAQIGVTFYV